jgi:hypothetical protein
MLILQLKNMEKKQTAVEWLVEEIEEARRLCDDSTIEMDIWHTLDVLIKKSDQAKQMEKEFIKDAWNNRNEDVIKSDGKTSEKYYNNTFGGNNE